MEEKFFEYSKYSYRYFLIKQDRKTISLTIYPNLNILLKCPIDCGNEKIERFLKRKYRWVEKQISYFKKYRRRLENKEYISGESFLYLGRQYKLFIEKAKEDRVVLKRGKLIFFTTKNIYNKKYNKKMIKNWYSVKMLKIFNEEYRDVLKKFNYCFEPQLATREMNKRWGSFLSNKKIILNPKLIQAPKECVNYVITHELCHMKHKNHDKNFFKLLKSKINNWEEIKEKLELRFCDFN